MGLIVVLLWIGGLKAFRYEADGIVPFVANSPTMRFFYADPGNYKAPMNPEGARVPANRSWHESNRTYEFAYGLVTMADSAKAYLRKRAAAHSSSRVAATEERLTTASV